MKLNDNIKYFFDFIVVCCTLIALIILIGYARPLVIAPVEGLVTSNNSVLFSFEKGSALLIDDNLEFSSPDRVITSGKATINLNPGTYYWKVEGALNSPIRKLTVNSKVGLTLKEGEKEYEVINSGNVPLDVSVYLNGSLVEVNTVSPSAEFNSSGDMFIGGQK